MFSFRLTTVTDPAVQVISGCFPACPPFCWFISSRGRIQRLSGLCSGPALYGSLRRVQRGNPLSPEFILTLCLLITTFVVFTLFYYPIKPLLLGMKWTFKNRDLQIGQNLTNMHNFQPLEVVDRGKNEMNRALGHLCAHIGETGPGEPPEDGEMIEMTLSSRHRIWNSSPGGLRPSTLPLGHGGSPQYWLSHVDGEETFLVLSNRRDREPNPELWRERQRC